MLRPTRFVKSFACIISVLIISFSVGYFAFAWTEPSMSPPGGNASPPINVSGITQTKTGTLQVPMVADPITPTYYIAPGGPVSASLYGKVGIGTDNPGAMLDVNGQIKISGGTPGSGKVLTSDATGLASWQSAASGIPPVGPLGQTLHSDGTNWVADSSLFNNGTNVGIGTTNPGAKLEVSDKVIIRGNDEPNISIISASDDPVLNPLFVGQRSRGTLATPVAVQPNDTLWEGYGMGWDGDSFEPGASIRFEADAPVGVNNVPGHILFKTTPVGGGITERMVIKNNGNVGIGTTDPSAKLEVSDGGAATNTTARPLAVHGNAGGPTLHTASFYNNKANGVGAFGYGLTLGARDNDSYGSIQSGQFGANGVLSGPELPLVLNEGAGYVGIGTNSPNAKLDVAGNVRFSGTAEGGQTNGLYLPNSDITVGGGTDGIFGFHHTGQGAGQINFGNPYWPPVTGWTMSINVKTSRVGIGTTNPNAKLDINDNSFILEQSQTPATSSSSCTVGMHAWDANYIYVCVAANTWKRAALSVW